MPAQLIDGNALAKKIRADVTGRTEALKARGVNPYLAILLVGEDPASQVYTKHKVNDSTETGLTAVLETHPATLPEAESPIGSVTVSVSIAPGQGTYTPEEWEGNLRNYAADFATELATQIVPENPPPVPSPEK